MHDMEEGAFTNHRPCHTVSPAERSVSAKRMHELSRSPYLVTFQGVFSSERLPTSAITKKGLVSGMRVSVPFQVVLSVEGQGALVTREWPRRGCGVLRRGIDGVLIWHLLGKH
jgi:hypothetical protein